MKALIPLVALGLACGGSAGPAPDPEAIRPGIEAALLERDAARQELARLDRNPGGLLDRWRQWRARNRFERVVLELDALERRRLEARARAMREEEARSTAVREEMQETLRRASLAMREGDYARADSLYARAGRMLGTAAAETPAPVPNPALPDPGDASGRALLAERVRLVRRLARLSDERTRVAAAIARLEEDRSRLSGLRRFRGVLDRGDVYPRTQPEAQAAVPESSAMRVLEARLATLRAEGVRREEEAAGLRAAVERIDAAVATPQRPSGSPSP